MTELFDHAGRRVSLGQKLGSGGEGAVYDVPSLGQEVAAKVYHGAVTPDRQTKLRSMVKCADESLRKISAWPVSTLHQSSNGPLRGFLMPKMVGYEPIHHLYGPSQRKQRFPKADWAFLLNTARNIAAAFETIHSHDHVIGDVNPNLVFVADNTLVKLIDCDSFQITLDGKSHLCEVGVPHFTPPELQGKTSFRGVQRTKNHDCFGLALLIFHVLLMGRHPFSGVYAGAGDMSLEKAIAEFKYAFGRDAHVKKMAPPPNSVTPGILSKNIVALFEAAFGESLSRPSARDWVSAIDALKGQLRACGQNSVHKYSGELSSCPWCEQEQRTGTFFFLASVPLGGTQAGTFSLAQAWARIMAVPLPDATVPQFNSWGQLTPRPLPQTLVAARTYARLKKIGAAMISALVIFGWHQAWPLLIVAAILFFSGGNEIATELRTRRTALEEARKRKFSLDSRWQQEASILPFQNALKELTALRTEYEGLGVQIKVEQQKLEENRLTSQLNKFLDAFFIENYEIPSIGTSRKAVLASFGIETAADITWNKVIRVRGFGEKLTRDLVGWRKKLEGQFKFDPSKGVDPSDIADLNQRFSSKRKQLEAKLLEGPEKLTQIKSKIQQVRVQLSATMQEAAKQFAQTEADMNVMN